MEERADCFTLIVFLVFCDCYCSAALSHGAVGWCVVVVFPDHTHIRIGTYGMVEQRRFKRACANAHIHQTSCFSCQRINAIENLDQIKTSISPLKIYWRPLNICTIDISQV